MYPKWYIYFCSNNNVIFQLKHISIFTALGEKNLIETTKIRSQPTENMKWRIDSSFEEVKEVDERDEELFIEAWEGGECRQKEKWCQRKRESCDLPMEVKEAGRDGAMHSKRDKRKNCDLRWRFRSEEGKQTKEEAETFSERRQGKYNQKHLNTLENLLLVM